MSTIDLSRSATDYRKHYKSVRAQQGRVFVDDDHNDNERIHTEEQRRDLVDIIGPSGVPGDGFKISNPRLTNGKLDFDIAAGAFYLGGNRLQVETPGTTYQLQPDWLELFGSPTAVNPPAANRTDLVYLETWMQPVAAVEDSELFEVALGGPDTSTRMKQMQQIRLFTGIGGTDCQTGWAAFVANLAAQGRGRLNQENELVPNTQLTVLFPGTGQTDLCSPPVAGGYLGAENQAIRVQIVDATHFTWGFDNAAPLYRVQLSADANGALTVITMMTEPKDQAHWPMAQQVVELLPWSAVLPNEEKTADLSGFMTRVATSYDPDTKEFTISTAVPATFGNAWQQRSDAGQFGNIQFFYMRIWNRGSDTTSDPAILFASGTAVDLLGTGLQVVFNGTDRPFDDYWIIAARPDSPDQVVPWQLETGKGPNGYRRYFAPLGVIQWTVPAGGVATGTVIDDCRIPFQPLTRIRSCCTFTVGDGETSFGKFTSIQQAINALPASGGEICILPGRYKETITIQGLHDVIIHGCDRQTVLTGDGTPTPVFTIQDSQRITLQTFSIQTNTAQAVFMQSTPAGIANGTGLITIHIYDLDIEVRDAAAVFCQNGQYIRIADLNIWINKLAAPLSGASPAGLSPAIFLQATQSEILQNSIRSYTFERLNTSVGGIQIGGGSIDVTVRENLIEGGNGNGITLGSISYVTQADSPNLTAHFKAVRMIRTPIGVTGIFVDPNGCIHWGGGRPPTGPGGNPLIPVSDGIVQDIRILDNEITTMGGSGIANVDPQTGMQGLLLVVGLEITHNRITGCTVVDQSANIAAGTVLPGRGGVSLNAAEYVTIRDNFIADNGHDYTRAICGIWVLWVRGIIIERNQIVENGPRATSIQPLEPGPRGGIVLEAALQPPLLVYLRSATDEPGFPALRVHDNVVITSSGPALAALVIGIISVQGNQLTCSGLDQPSNSPYPLDKLRAFAGGAAVFLFDLALTPDFSGADVDFATMGLQTLPDPTTSDASVKQESIVIGGNVMFNDNLVFLNVPESDENALLSSITLISLSDVSFEGNQCQAMTGNHQLFTNVFLLSWSVRMADNRCEDPYTQQGLSALTIAFMNSTTDNQGTRCFEVIGLTSLRVNSPNKSLVSAFSNVCGGTSKRFQKFFESTGLSA